MLNSFRFQVGRAYFETEKKHFTILDAPGHKSYVPNMIGGASQVLARHMTPTLFRNTDVNGQVWLYSYQADLAVLVISARKGEFETGFERGGQVWGTRYAAENIKAEYSWKEDNTGLLLSFKWQTRVLLVWLTHCWSRPYLKHKLSKVSSLEREVGCYIMALLDIRLLHERVKAPNWSCTRYCST